MAKVGSGEAMCGAGRVLREILEWSKDKPPWQRDALRRLLVQCEMTPKDESELLELCRAEHKLAPMGESVPAAVALDETHLPASGASVGQVSLLKVSELQHVNAVADGQELTFGPTGLTVVYGDCGSGKSGYGRVLKRACRARNRGSAIRPDVFKTHPGVAASAEITFALNGREGPPAAWVDDDEAVIPELSRVSFIDAECAVVHVREENGIAFTPFGLDILESLGGVCRALKGRLDNEKALLTGVRAAFSRHPNMASKTRVAVALQKVSKNTDILELRELATLTEADEKRLVMLPELLHDPKAAAKQLRTRGDRIKKLKENLENALRLVVSQGLTQLRVADETRRTTAAAADLAASRAFTSEPLNNVGSNTWRELWDSARRYSSAGAYTGEKFPVVTESARCVLCQQTLSEEAKERLSRFEEFVQADTERRAKEAATAGERQIEQVRRIRLRRRDYHSALEELELLAPDVVSTVRSWIVGLRLRRRAILAAWEVGVWDKLPDFGELVPTQLDDVVATTSAKAENLEQSCDEAGQQKLKAEQADLATRKWLAEVLDEVCEHIERLETIDRLDKCLTDVRTISITTKSKALAKEHVTDRLRDAFATEMQKMNLRRVRVELVASSGEYGTSQYRVQFVGASTAEVGAVLSEGEHRCIALAGFLSELATCDEKSTIVLDDPVTSLDHTWRGCFARRLAEEAGERQIIVFTHDIVFLHDLLDSCVEIGAEVTLRRVHVGPEGVGLVTDTLPWIAQKVRDRIDTLEKEVRQAEGLYQANDFDGYERSITSSYGRFRATVERAIEEQLFRNVVLRHRDYINPSELAKVSAVELNDCRCIKKLHKKCCDVTEAHDPSTGRNGAAPPPQELLSELKELRDLVDTVKERQKQIA